MEIWQVGFYDWTIRDYNDWQTKVEYIHKNPVRAKLVEKPNDWPYSSVTGQFGLDPIPTKFLNLSSGAKAQVAEAITQGLKPLPPKEGASEPKLRPPEEKVFETVDTQTGRPISDPELRPPEEKISDSPAARAAKAAH